MQVDQAFVSHGLGYTRNKYIQLEYWISNDYHL